MIILMHYLQKPDQLVENVNHDSNIFEKLKFLFWRLFILVDTWSFLKLEKFS